MKAVRLSSNEKNEILARTFSVIEKIELLTIPQSAERKAQPVVSPFLASPWKVYFVHRKFVPSLVIVAILFVTGGASVAAEGALPGDSLYGLKLNINEEVRGLTAVTPESKARVAVESAERRLQEVASLSAKGKLNDQTKAIAQQEFKRSASQVKTSVASLVSENNLVAAQGIAINYESSLKAHEVILEKISSDFENKSDKHLSSFIDTVKDELATTTVSRLDLQVKEVNSSANPGIAYESKVKEVRLQIEETLNLRIENADVLSTSTLALVAGKISEAQVLTIKAEGYMTATSTYPDAITSLQRASTLLSDAQGIIAAEAHLDIDVKKALGIPLSNQQATSTASTTVSVGASATSSASTKN